MNRFLPCWCALMMLPFLSIAQSVKPPTLKLWYRQPATYFEEALLIGNGRQGAIIYGAPDQEKIHLNDLTLWSGEPTDPDMNPESARFLPLVREALRKEDYEGANKLLKNIQGKFSESYAPLGTLSIHFDHASISNYYRELNVENAQAMVSYRDKGSLISRQYLFSHPDSILAIRLKSTEQGGLKCSISYRSLLQYQTKKGNNSLQVEGVAPYKAEPNYTGNKKDAVLFDWHKGTRFAAAIQVIGAADIRYTDSSIEVDKGTDLLVLVAMATSFNGSRKSPSAEGLDAKAIALNRLAKAADKNWATLVEAHERDYKKYFDRVNLELSGDHSIDLPTDERLKRYATGAADPYLETLYFQFGRYLLISSSRTPG
ncbi:MAG: Alpha-L-fucosidase, partial [Bacteroidota bacterium]